MNAQTAMAAAMERAGIDPRDAELNVALARYRNRGGTFERGYELLRGAYELPGEDHSILASDGQHIDVSARQPNGDEEGQQGHADEAIPRLSSSSPQEPDGTGHLRRAGDGPAEAARPVVVSSETIVQHAFRDRRGQFLRTPTPSQLRAAAEVARDGAITVLDTYKIRDGRAIGSIRIGELEGLRVANAMEASLVRQIQRHAVADPSAYVRDVVKAADLQRMIQRAAEAADAT